MHLPSDESWSDIIVTADGQGVFTFSGGNVTFNGISYGSVATYTTTGDYRVNGEQSFQRICQNGEWMSPATITIASKCCFKGMRVYCIVQNYHSA